MPLRPQVSTITTAHLVVTSSRTPNPRSIKFTATNGQFGFGGLHSFGSAREAVGHTLGESLFAIPAVSNVLILPDFVTVTLHDAADWDKWLERIVSILDDAVQEIL